MVLLNIKHLERDNNSNNNNDDDDVSDGNNNDKNNDYDVNHHIHGIE
jgi:hypothetical protein